MKLLFVTMLMVGSALAQCPVKFKRTILAESVTGMWVVVVGEQNESNKAIIGQRIEIDPINAVGEKTEPRAEDFSRKIKPGKDSAVHVTLLDREVFGQGVTFRIDKVLFEDGTTWEPAAGEDCSVFRKR